MGTTVGVGAEAPKMTVAQMVTGFVALRDKIAMIKKADAEKLAPYQKMLNMLEASILASLEETGSTSIRCDGGTAFTVVHTAATVTHWADLLDFIRDNDAWELLEPRVSKTAAEVITQERGEPIPGVKISQVRSLNVRRS